jgi:hypothetical protein
MVFKSILERIFYYRKVDIYAKEDAAGSNVEPISDFQLGRLVEINSVQFAHSVMAQKPISLSSSLTKREFYD